MLVAILATAASPTQDPAALISRMQRCISLSDQADTLRRASDARVAAALARSPARLAPPEMQTDFEIEESLTPAGLRLLDLTRRYTACLAAGGTTPPSPACARDRALPFDLLLAANRRWLTYRGPMPGAVHNAAEAQAWRVAWIAKRNAFAKADQDTPDAKRLEALRIAPQGGCGAGSPPLSDATSPEPRR